MRFETPAAPANAETPASDESSWRAMGVPVQCIKTSHEHHERRQKQKRSSPSPAGVVSSSSSSQLTKTSLSASSAETGREFASLTWSWNRSDRGRSAV